MWFSNIFRVYYRIVILRLGVIILNGASICSLYYLYKWGIHGFTTNKDDSYFGLIVLAVILSLLYLTMLIPTSIDIYNLIDGFKKPQLIGTKEFYYIHKEKH